jgi:ligand-binding sensor domain-containing protein
VSATAVPSRWSLEGAPRITALTVEPRTGIVWVGTRDHGLFRIEGDTARRVSAKPEVLDREITALAVDAGGALWVALYENGLARKVGEQWTAFTPTNSSLPDWSIGRLAPGLTGGVWYIPHAEARSRGLGFFDGTRGHLHNPPHTVLDRPSSIAVDPRGHVWIGTWFDGLYELETAGAKK